MKIRCDHGYFFFEEERAGEISKFSSLYGFTLVPKDTYYTFAALELAPDFSLVALPYLGVPAVKTFEGKPWTVMRENGFVYNFGTGLVVPIESVITRATVYSAGFYLVSDGLLLPGSLSADGKRVTEYTAHMVWDQAKFRYTEVVYE